MGPIELRRALALLTATTLLASLTVIAVAAPASAATPKCGGKTATIVSNKKIINGTSKADVIVAKGTKDNKIYGKGGNDRICAGKGNDKVYAGRGNDLVFAGGGRDLVYGEQGEDHILGQAGKDTIYGGKHADVVEGGTRGDYIEGGPGPDVIRGGDGSDDLLGRGGNDKILGEAGNDDLIGNAGTDLCKQGAGAGLILTCENTDLEIIIEAPDNAPAGSVDHKVTVINHGPSAVAYTIHYANGNTMATCSGPDSGPYPEPVLAAGEQRVTTFTQDCETDGAGATLTGEVSVSHVGRDTDPSNDSAVKVTTFTS